VLVAPPPPVPPVSTASEERFVFEHGFALLNIAVLHTSLAATANVATEVGMRTAVLSLQDAAGYFAAAKHHVETISTATATSTAVATVVPSLDLELVFLDMLAKVAEAQAQQLMWRRLHAKSSGAVRPDAAVKVAHGAASLYRAAGAALMRLNNNRGGTLAEDWLTHLNGKAHFYEAEACRFQATLLGSDDANIGAQIALLRKAVACAEAAAANGIEYSSTTMTTDAADATIGGMVAQLRATLASRESDNRCIYQVVVPPEKELPPLHGQRVAMPTAVGPVTSQPPFTPHFRPTSSMRERVAVGGCGSYYRLTAGELLQPAIRPTLLRFSARTSPRTTGSDAIELTNLAVLGGTGRWLKPSN
jgi:hypothetical protein